MSGIKAGILALKRAIGRSSRLRRQVERVRGSAIFDASWYLAHNLDVAASGMDPVVHFCRFGAFEGRDPGPLFDLPRYLDERPDVAASGINALLHYLDHGAREDVTVSGYFDGVWYREHYPEAVESGLTPLEHYIAHGGGGTRDPGPRFSSARYIERVPSLLGSGENFLRHYFAEGASRDISCDPEEIESDAAARERALLAARQFFGRFGFSFSTMEGGDPEKLRRAAEYVASLTPAFPMAGDEPDVSIVVPAFGQLHFVLSLLESLAAHRTKYSCEIVIADDASPPPTCMHFLDAIPWIRVERNPENLGFLRSCNRVAEKCSGRYLVLLNSDTRMVTGWLDELIATFENFPRAGVAGSKLLFENLVLQDAGGVLKRDGEICLYGRGGDPDDPLYAYAREADYVSGASIALPRSVWNELGGFDEAFAPAYCEDVDLAFRARQAGYEVWYQPASQVIHHEGMTHGRDVLVGVKAFQLVNQRKILDRWRHVLAEHGSPGPATHAEANRYAGDPLLVLDVFTPTPDRDAGSHLAFSLMRAYADLGWRVLFAPVGYGVQPGYTRALQRLGIECLYRPRFEDIESVAAHLPDLRHILGFRVSTLSPIYDDIRRYWPEARLVYNTVDLHHRREARQAELLSDPEMLAQSAATREHELRLAIDCDCTVYLSENEREAVAEAMGPEAHENALVFPYVVDVPETSASLSGRNHVLFLGGFGHPPNIDAAIYLKENIWPALRAALPETSKLLIVGADPPEEVLNLADERVEVTGFVPDLAPVFASARVCVAPIRYGAGIKGKVIHALAHGVPSVVSPVASEGMGLTDGREVFIEGDPAAFAERVLRLFADEALWAEMRGQGIAFVQENYSWARCLARCAEAFDIAGRTWNRRHARSDGNFAPPDLG